MGTTRPIRVYQWCNAGHYVEQSDAIRQEADSKLCCPIHLKPLALTEKKFLVPSEAYDRPRQPKLMPSAPVAVAVGVASTAVLPDNYERKGLVLINTSANIISLAFVYPAVRMSWMSSRFRLGRSLRLRQLALVIWLFRSTLRNEWAYP
jgi:hypothetical protein